MWNHLAETNWLLTPKPQPSSLAACNVRSVTFSKLNFFLFVWFYFLFYVTIKRIGDNKLQNRLFKAWLLAHFFRDDCFFFGKYAKLNSVVGAYLCCAYNSAAPWHCHVALLRSNQQQIYLKRRQRRQGDMRKIWA